MTQKYTRWRDNDCDDDDEVAEGTIETLEEEEDDLEARRAFALMTPQRDEPQKTKISYKLLAVMVTISLMFGVLGGAIGYMAADTAPLPSPVPQVNPLPSTTTSPPTTTTPVPQVPKENVGEMCSKMLAQLQPHHIKKYQMDLAGNPGDRVGRYIESTMRKLGYPVRRFTFDLTTSYTDEGKSSGVSLVYSNGTVADIFKSDIFQYTSKKTFSAFNGYSGNGTFNGTLVYGHYATEEDLQIVQAMKIQLNGTVLLIRRGSLHPGKQVLNAEKFGVKAVIFFVDPADRGNQDKPYPAGTALPMDAVVARSLRYIPGDPATVGYVSSSGTYSAPRSEFAETPTIPVQTVSAEVAKQLFTVLAGPAAPQNWNGSLSPMYLVGGNFKNAENVTSVRVQVNSQIGKTTLSSYHAELPSSDQSKVVHVGVHYDASPVTVQGSALGIAAWLAFAAAMKASYQNGTERQIVFHAFPGSTGDYSSGAEFIELYSDWIDETGLAYIDFDDILQGGGFLGARVSPLLRYVADEAMKHVDWPDKEGVIAKLGVIKVSDDMQNRKIPGVVEFDMETPKMCGESVNFMSHGIPSLNFYARDITFRNYSLQNTQYDDLKAITKLLDPELKWTHLAASLISTSALIVSNMRVPPVSFELYGRHLMQDWYQFKKSHKLAMGNSKYDFKTMTDAIEGELDILVNHLDNLDLWYKNESRAFNFASFRNEQNRIEKVMSISRRFLRPRELPSTTLLGGLITFGPDTKDPCKGVGYPMANKVIQNILSGKMKWEDLHKELSLIFSSVASLKSDIVKLAR